MPKNSVVFYNVRPTKAIEVRDLMLAVRKNVFHKTKKALPHFLLERYEDE